MKIITRILIILLAASVVVGATWALTRNGANAQFAPHEGNFRPNGNGNSASNTPNFGQRPEGFTNGGFRPEGRDRGGSFSVLSLLRTLIPLSVVVAIGVLLDHLISSKRSRHLAAQEEPPIE